MIVNICFNSTRPGIGLKRNRDRTTMRLYMADTGLLVSHAFDEEVMASGEACRKLLLGKPEFNEGMVFENMVAQMLTASGHKPYFYANPGKREASERMEIDFLIAKNAITNRHNVSPLEVKTGSRYTLSSLRKFMALYQEQLHIPYVIHAGDWNCEDGIIFLPAYMAGLL